MVRIRKYGRRLLNSLHFSPTRRTVKRILMKKFILQLGKEKIVCNDVEEAKTFISRFGHLTSAGEKRITGLFNGTIGMSRDFAWMMPKHIPELKNYPEQSCRMWVKPIPAQSTLHFSEEEIRKAVENM